MEYLLAIIVSWNRPEYLRRTLNSLFDQVTGIQADVVVVDNGSEAATHAVLRAESRLHGIHCFESNRGLNQAIETAVSRWRTPDHDWVLISDADMEYRQPLVAAVELLTEHPHIGAVSLQHSPEHPSHATIIAQQRSWPLKWTERGCALVLRTTTLLGLRPLPVDNLKDFDWWACRDAPRSLRAQDTPIAIQVGGARHLGWRAGDSTWQAEEIPEFTEFR